MITKERERVTTGTDEQRKRPEKLRMPEDTRVTGDIVLTVGIIEIILGVLAMLEAAFSVAVFTLLLGATITASGTLGIVTSAPRSNWTRLTVSIISVIAGLVVIAHPILALDFLGLTIGVYLLATGITRLFGRELPLWTRTAGVIAILLSIWVFIALPLSAVLAGVMVGINIILQGAITARIGTGIKRLA